MRGKQEPCHFTKREWADTTALDMSEMAPHPHQPAQRPVIRRIIVDLAIMTVIGVILALIGPFGSFEQPLPIRLLTWVGFAWLGYAIYAPMSAFVSWGQRALDLPAWGLWIAGVLIATIPMTALVWSAGFIGRTFVWPSLEDAMVSYLYVLVIGGGITALFYALGTRERGVGEANVPDTARGSVPFAPSETAIAEPSAPAFLDRLPPSLGSDLIALEMEDHYVRAHTALGSEMVLMRMRDAIAELDGIDGIQVHRSWWVARGAVEDVRREGRNVRLVLARGIEAPVSRANVSVLKEAGWI
jgi:hypothetical protein